MITFGLTGGIACGKSTATKTFIANNIPIVDADVVARQVVEPKTKGWSALVLEFSTYILNEDWSINRPELAKLVFNDKQAMAALNKIMGPLIQEESSRQINAYHNAGNRIVGYDAALICEMGNADKYRPLIVVSCPQDMQVARLMKRNNLTEAEAMSRINAQMSLEAKLKLADYVIDTSGPVENSIKQTEKIIHNMWASVYQKLLDTKQITYAQVPWPWRDTDGNTWIDDDDY